MCGKLQPPLRCDYRSAPCWRSLIYIYIYIYISWLSGTALYRYRYIYI
ncbi:unnamed protein product [Ixodes pacificus]